MPNLKFATLAILELLAINAQNIVGHVTLTPPPIREFFRGHVGTLPGIMRAKFKVRTFSHLRGQVTLATPLCTRF